MGYANVCQSDCIAKGWAGCCEWTMYHVEPEAMVIGVILVMNDAEALSNSIVYCLLPTYAYQQRHKVAF